MLFHSCCTLLQCRKCLWFAAAGGWRSHPLFSWRRNDQVHGSHTACGLLPAERRRTADPVKLLRYPASMMSLVDACLSVFHLDGVVLPLVPSPTACQLSASFTVWFRQNCIYCRAVHFNRSVNRQTSDLLQKCLRTYIFSEIFTEYVHSISVL